MKNLQLFIVLLFAVEPIVTSSVKKIKQKHRIQGVPRKNTDNVAADTIETVSYQPVTATTLVLQPSAYYQPKLDDPMLYNQAANDYSAHTAYLGQQDHSTAYEANGIDFSKVYKQIHQPQYMYGLGKYTDVVYKAEPLTVAYKDSHYTIPQSYSSHVQNHEDQHQHHHLHDAHDNHYASNYQFGYRVKDPHHGSYFGHSEVSDGHVTKGQYHVLLPDGRLQNVKYHADHSGYHAEVSYESSKYY